MKKLLLIMISVFSKEVFGMFGAETKEEVILIDNGSSENEKEQRPRTPSIVPLLCYHDNGIVSLELLSDLGEIQLIVTNQTTGEQWSTVNNLVLQTSTVSGVYLVEIVTENGDTYWGTYTINK